MCLEPWEDFCRFPAGESASRDRCSTSGATSPAQRWSLDEGRWIQPRQSHTDASTHKPVERQSCKNNLFVAFKNGVDRTIGVFGAPVSNMRRRRREAADIKRRLRLESDARWYGHTEGDIIPKGEAISMAINLLKTAEDKTLNVSPQAIDSLFKDDTAAWACNDPTADAMLAFGGACYFLPEIGDRLPSSALLFHQPPRPPRWLSIKWFKESPYSPVILGDSGELPGSSDRWRAAFEGLIDVTLGRSTDSFGKCKNDSTSIAITSSGPGLNWLLSLQLRGVLPPLLPSLRYTVNSPPGCSEVSNMKRSAWSSGSARNRSVKSEFDQLVEEIRHSGINPGLVNALDSRQASLNAANQTLKQPLEQELVKSPLEFSIALDTAEQQTIADRLRLPNAVSQQDYAAETLNRGDDFAQVKDPERAVSAVVATIKSTHASRLPDGSVLTRISMTTQFADGTETTHDTVHTGREG